MPVRSTHLSLRRRRPVFDVAGATDATSVSSLLQPTDQADACVCPRSCRHPPSCSVESRHSSRDYVNKRRFHRVARRRIRLQRHRGNLAWLPYVSSSLPHWSPFSHLLHMLHIAFSENRVLVVTLSMEHISISG